jgi:oligopeptidase B
MTINPPDANKIPKQLEIHGDTRIDNYYWMNERDSKPVLSYITEENDYTSQILKDTEDLQSELYKEITGRIKQQDESVPFRYNGYYYYSRFEKGKEYPLNCRKKESLSGDEEIFIDQNKMASGHEYFSLGSWSVSLDNKILAYSTDVVSRRQYKLRFRDIETGEDYPEIIENISGSAIWANDNLHIFYTKKDPLTLRSYQIYRHRLGTDTAEDVMVFEEKDEEFTCGVSKSKSEKYIYIVSDQSITTEVQFLDASKPLDTFKVFEARKKGHEYNLYHYEDEFYIQTNWNATNFKIMRTSVDELERENWKEVIAHRDNVLIDGIDIFKHYLVIEERKEGLNQLRVISDSGKDYYIPFEEPAYMVGTSINLDYDTEFVRYYYSSLTTPPSTFDFNMLTGQSILLKEKEIMGGFDKANYQSERVWANARDGKKIPISIVYNKKTYRKDGKSPLLLYGYGSYGYSIDPAFAFDRISLLDRGFAYAIAHVRGGEDLGRQWYEDGKMLSKKNTFYDFIDCGKYLIQEEYTKREKIFAMGGSAGGLLMGAVINLEPGLFKGVIAAVPFVDVVTTMLDESIPLTTGEFDEWGNPKDKPYYDYMLSYSPIDNVAEKKYPNLLITTGYHDSQVQYWEPLKWIAKLRDYNQSDNHLLLFTQMEAGHGGASGRFRKYKETAMEYAFILKVLGEH